MSTRRGGLVFIWSKSTANVSIARTINPKHLEHSKNRPETPANSKARSETSTEHEQVSEDADEDLGGVTKDGWIWSSGQLKKMSEKEIQEWELESELILLSILMCLCYSKVHLLDDRIQWFRAESEFERKQEALERKHAEFIFLCNSFKTQRDVWASLASSYSETPGHVAYAKEHSDMFQTLRADAEVKYEHCAIPFLRNSITDETITDWVDLWRREEDKHFVFDQ